MGGKIGSGETSASVAAVFLIRFFMLHHPGSSS
jgi:hypothetical protein